MSCQNLKQNSEHMWPRHGDNETIRTTGTVGISQCNNCLAIRVTMEWLDKSYAKRERVSIVEDPRNEV